MNIQVVNRLVANYECELANREATQYKVSRPSSSSMDVVTPTEHRAITLSRLYYDQASLTTRVETGKLSTPAIHTPTGTAFSLMDIVEPSVNRATTALVAYAPQPKPVTPSQQNPTHPLREAPTCRRTK